MTNLTATIDALGVLKAQMAELAKQEKALKAILIDAIGTGSAEGDLYRVTISQSIRETLDMDAVREKLSRQFIAAHTRETEVTTVNVKARNGKQLAA